ncbi:CDP-alcohol phosphatidyltransferase [Reichenbachiella faecimaris]|uniref:CDP-alcohol phosphatidyltransferase n=1 Tax=Reichenbachiella faecimaris TaxID=692418 RepID=A0A1W2G8B8_REIFA|nr:CDP-alcohol phosphatidyltransferase family protein [Reichenbachiella faecimaris]SMD32536.1 CDP-alcohol phosphatidyltransferase [Reichenbachiella faecimaris]
MLRSVRNHFSNHNAEVQSTIKLIDIEERFDLAFSRFFGLYFAKLGKFFNMTPTQVSIISLIIGVTGGYMLFYQDSWVITVWASVLITLAGVLDSADGQLARMTGQSTELGRFIDGFIDSAIFIAIYLSACAYYVQGEMGWSIFLLAIPAGIISHIFTSQIYDFYKSEFLYYVAGSESSKVKKVEELPDASEEEGFWNKFFRRLEIDYTKRQWLLVTRTEEMRDVYEEVAFNEDTKEQFREKYRATFNPIMFWWALVGGTNTHRTLIMLFSIMGRFDLYLIVCLIKLIPIAIVILAQKFMDEDFMKELKFQFATQESA